ncbi:hypothetical protein GKE82_17845 [Conexibacter sp. W3-3-2]|uniref:hypothetical protein n=1 Tax=Conexibacter sp. W3-3-2 TaxID=2675227 RepID=UPI0012B83BE5|nr:hypothetical protein [Conexibacter sp. W3-3-2]MTD46096.1 hypothetical protein [Conexibacter sp. W3-3-2]
MTVAERLERARTDRELLTVEHAPTDEAFDGYVVAVGPEWFALAVVEPAVVALNGLVVLRLVDVAADAPEGTFVARALEHQGVEVPGDPGLELHATGKLLESAAARHAVVTVHTRQGEVLIGVPTSTADGRVELLEVDADAEWMDDTPVIAHEDVARVDLGGRYEQLLYELAGPPPG